MNKLIEICVVCGFDHRDDRVGTRQRKAHFHWAKEYDEPTVNEGGTQYTFHPAVCIGCAANLVADSATIKDARAVRQVWAAGSVALESVIGTSVARYMRGNGLNSPLPLSLFKLIGDALNQLIEPAFEFYVMRMKLETTE